MSDKIRSHRSAVHIVRPDTVIAWHRRGFRLFWMWKSRRRTGGPSVAPAAPCLREPGPQHPVGRRDAKTRASRSIHDGQLVSERDDLQVQRGA